MTWNCSAAGRSMLLATVGVIAGACGGFNQNADQIARLQETTAELREIGVFPEPGVMADDVELVTFEFAGGGPGETYRDTLRGPEAVSAWLERLYAQQLPAVEFRLSPHESLLCDGAAIQNGTYQVAAGPQGQKARQPYRARWVPGAGGAWQLDRLWLDPPSDARVGRVATECRSIRDLELGSYRWMVTAEMRFAPDVTTGPVVDRMWELGWNDPSRYEGEFPKARSGGTKLGLSVVYRITPRWGVQGLLLQDSDYSVRGRLGVSLGGWQPKLSVDGTRVIGVLGVRDLGWMQVGAGPALASTEMGWTENYDLDGEPPPAPVKRSTTGVMGQLSATVPFTRWLRAYVAARYLAAGDVEVPAFADLASFKVPISGVSLGLGAALTF